MNERILIVFNNLNQNITETTVVSHPQGINNFTIICDISNEAIRSLLLQNQQGEDVSLEFVLKSLLPPKRNYDAYEREAYVISLAVYKFEVYIKVNCCTILTNQHRLKKLMSVYN